MKLKGRKFTEPFSDILVIPRGDNEPAVFKARAIMSFAECDKYCPQPMPPKVRKNDGSMADLTTDKTYQNAYARWAEQRMAWIVIESLKATEDLEWETVNYIDPNTWTNWKKELEDSFFTTNEILQISRLVFNVNSLNEGMLEDAKNSFLVRQQASRLDNLSSPAGQSDMPSGQPASV